MNIKYFQDTDTLYIEFRPAEVAETRDLDENTLLDIDREGNICGITVEHASDRAGISQVARRQKSLIAAPCWDLPRNRSQYGFAPELRIKNCPLRFRRALH